MAKGQYVRTPELKEKLRQARLGKKGTPHTEEWKKMMREKLTGREFTPEAIEKMRQAKSGDVYKGENNPFYGKKHTEETRRLMSENHADFKGENNPRFGTHHSEETREKMRQAKLDKTNTDNVTEDEKENENV